MTGSLKRFKYDLSTDNSGNYVYYTADESNHEALIVPGGAFDGGGGESMFDFVAADSGVVQLPLPKDGRDFTRRKARFIGSQRGVKLIIIPSQAMADALFNGSTLDVNQGFTDPDTGEQFLFTRNIPQQIAKPVEFDTGKDDGDAT